MFRCSAVILSAMPSLLLVSIGNTRIRVATVRDDALEPSRVLATGEPAEAAQVIAAMAHADGDASPRVVISTVNPVAAEAIEAGLRGTGVAALRFGRELAIPMVNTLEDDSTVGQDRLLDALGAFARSKQACIVIDAGTAITVDFVDGEGTFHGGAIAPGLAMMLRALHEQTAALPEVTLTKELVPGVEPPMEGDEKTPFGKTTLQAMSIGVVSAARGLVHLLIDRYAEFYNAYPRVVATGGDAVMLFENDPLVETIVPDLTLIGMLEAVQRLDALAEAGGDDDPG